MLTNGFTSTREVISFTFCEASLFIPSKPDGRAPKNSFCNESKSMLAARWQSSLRQKKSARNTRQMTNLLCNLIGLFFDQSWYSLNKPQFDCSVFRFAIVNSSKNSTEYASCFIFLFDLENNEINEKKKISKEASTFPGRFGALTWRPWDLMKNLETPGKTGRVDRFENSKCWASVFFHNGGERSGRRCLEGGKPFIFPHFKSCGREKRALRTEKIKLCFVTNALIVL